jgi:catechol 2,3-dioxygenase-like lactoylglutathione lyase family enzyme
MSVLGVSHVAIGVREMERSLAFYTDVIGLTLRYDSTEELPELTIAPETRRRAVYLQYADYHAAPNASYLVLDQQLGQEQFGEPAKFFQIGLHHFAFWVDDVDDIIARAAKQGITPFHGPMEGDDIGMGEQGHGRHRTAIFQDPDGNIVQCDQRLQSSGHTERATTSNQE